jgi:hypothetical protein
MMLVRVRRAMDRAVLPNGSTRRPSNVMDWDTIDQTASEQLLHRVLYVLKFLRAMVLYVMLGILAAVLFMLTGINGLYPAVDNGIRALRAVEIQHRLQGGIVSAPLYWTIVALMVAAVLAALIWIYRSITAVRPLALRFQALSILALALMNVHQTWPALRFAFEHLNLAFAVLATLGVAMTLLVFPASVAQSLWQVSRAPERSSLVATLDPRLAPNRWVYLNKLLDLPRTPLRTFKTGAAYVLALAGTLLLIASVMHLMTLGGASNFLSTLAIICKLDQTANCMALSSTWAWQMPLTLLLAAAGLKSAAWLQSLAKRLGGLSVSDVLRRPADPFVLYLRPFDTDEVILPTPRLPLLSRLFSFRPFPVRIEEELFDVADGYRPLIAVGKPGTQQATSGGVAYRAFLDDSAWQSYVADKVRRAERIVLLMKVSDGVRWEIERVIAEGAAFKTLFLFDPAMTAGADWATLERTVVPLMQRIGAAPQGLQFNARPIGFYFQRGSLVQIINTNRSATSYRTAFSHFLAESLV